MPKAKAQTVNQMNLDLTGSFLKMCEAAKEQEYFQALSVCD
jgi:hypothetical protein